ncbi:hypothetical protein T4B_4267 [Trichinella pseudospiralis]|uniref:Uncharacterized protein n=1 Tax=Trichinella pseudospiralis TaxID=6337 RepID=A0A0V1GVH5_TRIPS|nr:hypothetical protein T4B_4267 [Trichinella pseudospiralis]
MKVPAASWLERGLLTFLKSSESECAIAARLPAMFDDFEFKNILMRSISIHSVSSPSSGENDSELIWENWNL